MKTVSLRDAKAGFSSLVDDAMKGEMVTITRHGRPAAVLVSIAAARRIAGAGKADFGKFLQSFPGGLEVERNRSAMRKAKL